MCGWALHERGQGRREVYDRRNPGQVRTPGHLYAGPGDRENESPGEGEPAWLG